VPNSAESQKTVLIVDDDNDVRGALETRLLKANFRVLSASSGSEALNLAELHRPDAITLDVRLPDLDGVEVANRLRSADRTAATPIVFVTGNLDSHVREAAHWMSDTYFLRKPYDSELLIVALQRAIRHVDGPDSECDVNQSADGTLPGDEYHGEFGDPFACIPGGSNDGGVQLLPSRRISRRTVDPSDAFRMYDLVDDVTHDARSTLFVISELTSLVCDGLGGDEHTEQRRLLRVVRDRTAELRQLFDMLLTGAKVQADLIRNSPEQIPLAEFLRLVVSDCRRHASRKNCTLEISSDRELAALGGDVELARISLLSLFAHVVHAAEHESEIRLRVGMATHRGRPAARFLLEARSRLELTPDAESDLEWDQTRRALQLGSGPKLALAAVLAQLNGGRISIEGDRRQMSAELLVPMAEVAALV
jgi:CheY-like chemotaxis protein